MKTYNDLKLLKKEPVALINLLGSQFRLILQVFILKKEGMGNDEIASYLNVNPYRIKMAARTAANYNIEDVKQIIIDLSTLDAKIKRGEVDRYVDLELFLATK